MVRFILYCFVYSHTSNLCVYFDERNKDMMSIQMLYSRQCPKSLNGDPSMFRRGPNGVTNEEILAIIGRVQAECHIGSTVLDAQIARSEHAASLLRQALTSTLSSKVDADLAKALAKAAVIEVCESPVCGRCKGTGLFHRKGEGLVECSRCHGVGNHIPSQRELHRLVNSALPEDKRMSRDTFVKKHYETYMEAVDTLHSEAGEAAKFAKSILRKMEDEAIASGFLASVS